MANYLETKVKPIKTQLKNVKSAAKNKTGTMTRLNIRNFQDEELPHELLLATIQTTKIMNMSLLTIWQQIYNLVKLKYLKQPN